MLHLVKLKKFSIAFVLLSFVSVHSGFAESGEPTFDSEQNVSVQTTLVSNNEKEVKYCLESQSNYPLSHSYKDVQNPVNLNRVGGILITSDNYQWFSPDKNSFKNVNQ